MSSSSNVSSPSSSEHKKMSRQELQHKISKLEAKLEKIKKRARGHETSDTEQAKQRVLNKVPETMEKQFHTIMEKFNARGFVYSFHLENGTIVSGASKSLNNWWKDEVCSFQENQEGTVMGTSSIDSNDSGSNDQILPDHSSNDMTPAQKDSANDES